MKNKYLLFLFSVFFLCCMQVNAQFDERIDTALMHQLGFRKITVCEIKVMDQLKGTEECTPYMRYFYNEKGKLLEKHAIYNNQIGNRFLYRYNDLGQLAETKTLIYPNDSNSVDYIYDQAGNCIEQQVYYRGSKTEKWCYTFNELHQKTAEYRINRNSDTITTYTYTFSNGKPDLEHYSTGKQLRFVYRFQYDQWGNETGKKHVRGDMKLSFPKTQFSGPNKPVKYLYFDGEKIHSTKKIDWTDNRIVKETLIDSVGKVLNTSNLHYYPNGLIQEVQSMGGISHNNLTEDYEYDKNDRLIRKRSTFNGQENHLFVYEYDPQGRCISMQRYQRGTLEETKTYDYNKENTQPESERIQPIGRQSNNDEYEYEYEDTVRTATYRVSTTATIWPCLFVTQPHYPRPEILRKAPPTLYNEMAICANNAPFWYNAIGKPSEKVVNGDTIVQQKLQVIQWSEDGVTPKVVAHIQRTEIRRNGIQELTDRDSTGRIQLQFTRLENGTYSMRKLTEFNVLKRPEIQQTYTVWQVYTPQLMAITYYNAVGLEDSIVSPTSHTTYFYYNNQRQLVERKMDYTSGFISTTVYGYNANGQLIRETMFSTDGSISSDRHLTYEGKKLKQVTSSMPAPVHTYRFYYE